MSFSKMLDLLKQKEKGKIVIVKLGNFYVATEEDAVLLHDKLNLKCSCYKNKTCKIGFPVKALEKYIEYILNIILKIPRTEKFNIGNEYKISIYEILKNAIYINKVSNKLEYLNKIDAELLLQMSNIKFST